MSVCPQCETSFMSNSRGRPKVYCSIKCSRAAVRAADKPSEPLADPEPVETLAVKRAELVAAMAARLEGPRDLGSLRRDVDSVPATVLDDLLKHYSGSQAHVW